MENELINPTNASEIQVVEHLRVLSDDILSMYYDGRQPFRLKPQGMNTVIEKEAINLMEITTNEKTYLFGGITEKFYDEVVDYFSDLDDDNEEVDDLFIAVGFSDSTMVSELNNLTIR